MKTCEASTLSSFIGETEGRRIRGLVYRTGKMYVLCMCVCVYAHNTTQYIIYIFYSFRPSVCQSVCLSVRLFALNFLLERATKL